MPSPEQKINPIGPKPSDPNEHPEPIYPPPPPLPPLPPPAPGMLNDIAVSNEDNEMPSTEQMINDLSVQLAVECQFLAEAPLDSLTDSQRSAITTCVKLFEE